MEYTVDGLAKLSGVTARTLRYYDETGLLRPAAVRSNGYRIYGQEQVDRLQQILFYRELGFPLETIGHILDAPGFDRAAALAKQLAALKQRQRELGTLIATMEKTIAAQKGETAMNDTEKFEGLKHKALRENEAQYGEEIRRRYGGKTVEAANEKFAGMTQAQWGRQEQLSAEISEKLAAALAEGNPAGKTAQELCALHREWLCLFWPDGLYTKQAHRQMGEMYVADARFRDYYDAIAPGAAAFLRDALNIYCAD